MPALDSLFEHALDRKPRSIHVEVFCFYAGRLFEQYRLLQVCRVRDERPDASLLEREVARDRPTLVQLESIIVDVRDMPERLHRGEREGLVLALRRVDVHELVLDVELVEHRLHVFCARRGSDTRRHCAERRPSWLARVFDLRVRLWP